MPSSDPTARGVPAAAPATTACGSRSRSERGRVAAIRFGADACPAATAAAAWLANTAEGRSLLDAARLGSHDAHRACGIAGARAGCVEVAVDAFHAALGDAVARGADGAGRRPAGGRDVAAAWTRPSRWREAPADAFGITLRLWIDPLAPDADRACCAPGQRAAGAGPLPRARACRTSRSISARPSARRSWSRSSAGYEAGETPNPCTACNGALPAARAGRGRGAAGCRARPHRPLRAHRGGRRGVRWWPAGRTARRTRATCSPACPPDGAGAARVPARRPHEAGGARARGRARPGGRAARGRARRCASSAAATTARSSTGTARRRRPARSRTRPATSWDGMPASAGFTPGQRRGIGVSAPEPLYVLRTEPERSAVVVAPLRRLGTRRVAAAGRRDAPSSAGTSTRSSGTARRRSARRSSATATTARWRWSATCSRSRPARRPRCTTAMPSSGAARSPGRTRDDGPVH